MLRHSAKSIGRPSADDDSGQSGLFWALCAIVVGLALWVAMTSADLTVSRDCASIADQSARLACYDALARTSAEPAKGGRAPSL